MSLAQALSRLYRAAQSGKSLQAITAPRNAEAVARDAMLGIGAATGLSAVAVPAAAYGVTNDAQRLNEEARRRWLMDQIINGTPELRDRLDMVGLRDRALRLEIEQMQRPPAGFTQSMRPRVFYPRPNERRQDAQGYMGGGE